MNFPKKINKKITEWLLLSIAILMAIFALWQVNHLASQIQRAEEDKVRLWANAISQKNQLVKYTEDFFAQITTDEQRKMDLYAQVLRTLGNEDLRADIEFSLSYVNYIMDSTRTATIITNHDGYITSCRNIMNDSLDANLIGQKLEGQLLEAFSQNPPFEYTVWGMQFTLYYKESQIYSDLRQMLASLGETFLDDITNNSVFVPVIIVDSLQSTVIGSGNIPNSEFSTPKKLSNKLASMAAENTPIRLAMPNGTIAYVYYEQTPLLKALRWVPLLYVFIAIVLIVTSYYLFRTAHAVEQNRIWVGLAKETAHQLGTPISSLIAWTDYLENKTITPQYAQEIRKDLSRLETITHRFSKIGSTPELKETNVGDVIQTTIEYLQSRSPKKIKFLLTLPDTPMIAPLNNYLFQWVIENIAKNAIDAMGSNGTFSITAWHDEKQIFIDLSDTGRGIPTSVQKHIFESGFSTKQRGWGLGLPLALRIVEQYHNGKLTLHQSVEGQGTVFRIILNK